MGFGFKDGAGGGMTGSILTVTAPAGATVTISKGDKTRTKVAGTDGAVVFRGLRSGEWTVTVTEGDRTFQKQETIKSDYALTVSIFATLHITYPEGSTCTATDGVTTLTAPDTSGTWDCVVPSVGDWTVRITDGTQNMEKTVSITEDGQSETISVLYELQLQLSAYKMTQNYTTSASTVADDTDGVKVSFKSGSTFRDTGAYLNTPVDLTNFRKVTFHGSSSKGGANLTIYLAIFSNDKKTLAASVTVPTASDLSVYPLDCASLTGEHYLGVFAKVGASGGNVILSSIEVTME